MINVINEFAQKADGVVITPKEDNEEMFSISFMKGTEESPVIAEQMMLTYADALEMVNNEEVTEHSLCLFDRLVTLSNLRDAFRNMKQSSPELVDIFVNGRVLSIKLSVKTATCEEYLTCILDRDNDNMTLQLVGGNERDLEIGPDDVKDIRTQIKLDGLTMGDHETLLNSLINIYDYIQETK